jgi:hypothetical protein
MTSLWNYWINEPIYLDEGVFNIVKRKHAIYTFCREGILPLVRSVGFRIIHDEKKLTSILLQMLFAMANGKDIKAIPYEEKPYEEVYEYFCFVLDSQVWETFWSKWGSLQDFQEGSFGYPLRSLLFEFLWSWLQFETSPAIQDLLQELEDTEYFDEGSKGKDDPYLQESSKRDYHDRHW